MTDRADHIICTVFKVNPNRLKEATRTRDLARARQVCMYYHWLETKHSYARVAKRYNRKDHTTVMHAVNKVRELRRTDWRFDESMLKIEEIMKGDLL